MCTCTWQITAEQSLAIIHNFHIWCLKQLHKNLLNVKSSDCIDLLSKLHTSRAYSKIGTHFCFKQLNYNFLRSQSTDFGKDIICCSIERPLSLVNLLIRFGPIWDDKWMPQHGTLFVDNALYFFIFSLIYTCLVLNLYIENYDLPERQT